MKKAIAELKLFNTLNRTGMIICLFIFASCKRLEMFSHVEKGSDMYCVYKISDVKNTGTRHALKKGDIICLYCTGNFHCLLNTKQWIKVYEVKGGNPNANQLYTRTDTGISYYLETDNPSASCAVCPGLNKFEIFNN